MDINSTFQFGDASGAYTFTSGLDVSIYNVIWLCFGLIGVFLNCLLFLTLCITRGFHSNVKIIFGGFVFALMGNSIGSISQSTTVILSIKLNENFWLYYVNAFTIGFSVNLWQIILLVFAVERTVATVRNQTYEADCKFYLGAIMVIIAFIFSFLLGLNYFCFNFNMYAQIGLVFSLNAINLTALLILSFVNRKLRSITIKSKILLSQRYQVTENIRVLYILSPLVVAGIVASVLTLGIQTWQSLSSYSQMLRTNAYYMINSCFPTVCFIIVFTKDPIMRNKILYLLRKEDLRKIEVTSMSKSGGVIPVKNVVGKNLVIQDSPENHFAQLNSMWK